jgi:hypothetical protein
VRILFIRTGNLGLIRHVVIIWFSQVSCKYEDFFVQSLSRGMMT